MLQSEYKNNRKSQKAWHVLRLFQHQKLHLKASRSEVTFSCEFLCVSQKYPVFIWLHFDDNSGLNLSATKFLTWCNITLFIALKSVIKQLLYDSWVKKKTYLIVNRFKKALRCVWCPTLETTPKVNTALTRRKKRKKIKSHPFFLYSAIISLKLSLLYPMVSSSDFWNIFIYYTGSSLFLSHFHGY